MLVSFFLIALITVGGFGLTYLFSDDETWLWRAAAGCVGGSAVFGLVIFALACFFGLTIPTVAAALLLTLAPLAVFTLETRRARLKKDWETAKSKLDGANLQKALRFGYYIFFLILFWQFFDRAMLENAQEFSPARRKTRAICRFTSARFFRSPTAAIFRRKTLRSPSPNFPIRLWRI